MARVPTRILPPTAVSTLISIDATIDEYKRYLKLSYIPPIFIIIMIYRSMYNFREVPLAVACCKVISVRLMDLH